MDRAAVGAPVPVDQKIKVVVARLVQRSHGSELRIDDPGRMAMDKDELGMREGRLHEQEVAVVPRVLEQDGALGAGDKVDLAAELDHPGDRSGLEPRPAEAVAL